MNNIVLSDDQYRKLRQVFEYVMNSELDFFHDELASFGDNDAKQCVGYIAWNLAKELGLSSPSFDVEYSRTAEEFGFEEDV